MKLNKIINIRPHHINILDDVINQGKHYSPAYLGKSAEDYWSKVIQIFMQGNSLVGYKFVDGLDGICMRCDEFISRRCDYEEFKDIDDEAKKAYMIEIGKIYSSEDIKVLIKGKKHSIQ